MQNDNEYSTENKLLCALFYIGPFFILGRFMAKDRPKGSPIDFHSWQGGILFVLLAVCNSILDAGVSFIMFLPIIQEILRLLLHIAIFAMGVVLCIMGIVNALNGKKESLPLINWIEKCLMEHYR